MRRHLRSWLELEFNERIGAPAVRDPARALRRITCARAVGGCITCATVGLVGNVAAYLVRSNYSTESSSRLTELLPSDLDALASHTTIGVLGVQLLLFGGFRPTTMGWKRSEHPPASLLERVDLIAPTWKPRGRVDYSWPGSDAPPHAKLSLFSAISAPPFAVHRVGTTVASLARALEGIGLTADDFDGAARIALREMLTWSLPVASRQLSLSKTKDLTLLVLSFDATPNCRSVDDCPQPGPSNELLAATADAFASRRWSEYGQRVDIIAQWEVAAALHTLRQPWRANTVDAAHSRVVSVGTPGFFENTAQIFGYMLAQMEMSACDSSAGGRVVLLAHPDHLCRALRIGETAFKGSVGPCHGLQLVPAMQPYSVGWPRQPSSAAQLNLFADVSCTVHTGGGVRGATWYDESNGFFQDGEPQRWARHREVWLAYEFWARAKGVATGVIGLAHLDD
mmetsp:Transcript_21694/g.35785  ORF Transcript_21694/g.35785 Transcript_21694/m.35785 type:complete len:454 (-) Transcript_21694:228-1589(-)